MLGFLPLFLIGLFIELVFGAPYRRIVLQVPDPQATARELQPVTGAHTGTFR